MEKLNNEFNYPKKHSTDIFGFPAAKGLNAHSMTICEQMHLVEFGCPFEDKEECDGEICLMEAKLKENKEII